MISEGKHEKPQKHKFSMMYESFMKAVWKIAKAPNLLVSYWCQNSHFTASSAWKNGARCALRSVFHYNFHFPSLPHSRPFMIHEIRSAIIFVKAIKVKFGFITFTQTVFRTRLWIVVSCRGEEVKMKTHSSWKIMTQKKNFFRKICIWKVSNAIVFTFRMFFTTALITYYRSPCLMTFEVIAKKFELGFWLIMIYEWST